MTELPPHVKAWADELVAAAPPLTEEAIRAIRGLKRQPAAPVPAAQPQAA